jgi:hypothetical protein
MRSGEKIRTKLLTVPVPLRIGPVVRGRLDAGYKQLTEDGWTVLRFRVGNAAPESFEELDDSRSLLGGSVYNHVIDEVIEA